MSQTVCALCAGPTAFASPFASKQGSVARRSAFNGTAIVQQQRSIVRKAPRSAASIRAGKKHTFYRLKFIRTFRVNLNRDWLPCINSSPVRCFLAIPISAKDKSGTSLNPWSDAKGSGGPLKPLFMSQASFITRTGKAFGLTILHLKLSFPGRVCCVLSATNARMQGDAYFLYSRASGSKLPLGKQLQ
jgi:hypothetical protein